MTSRQTSKHPISRVNKSPLIPHKQHTIPITTSKDWYLNHDVKPPVSKHTASRPTLSAKIRSQVGRCVVLQQDVKSYKKLIVHCNEEYKHLHGDFGKKENRHRIVDSVKVDKIKKQFTELEQKLADCDAENNELKETASTLEKRLRQLEAKCMEITKKQKSMKEQLSASPKHLMKRPKVQGMTMSPSSPCHRATDPQLNKSVESVKAEKSDVQAQLSKYQSELDDLIGTERILKEKINGLQGSHNTITHAIQRLKGKEITFRSSRKHNQDVQKTATEQVWQNDQMHTLWPSQSTNKLKALENEHNQDVQKTATEQVWHNNQMHTLWPSQSTNKLEAMENDVRAHQERELQRAQLEIQQKAELTKESGGLERKIVDLHNQLNDANKRNDKLREQLMQTEREFENKWKDHINEKDKRIIELEKSISDESISHQKLLQQYEDQIKELKLKSESTSILNKVNENYRPIVAQKDSELKASQQRLRELSQKPNEDIRSLQTDVSTRQSDLENCRLSLNEKSTELLNAKKEFQFKEADLIRQVEKLEHQIEELKNNARAHQECELQRAQLEIQQKAKLTKENEGLEKRIVDLQNQLNDANERNDKLHEQLMQTEREFENKWIGLINEKDKRITELEKSISDEAISHQKLLQHQTKELKLKITELEKSISDEAISHQKLLQQYEDQIKELTLKLEKALEEKDLELAEAKDSYQTAMAQKNEGLRRRHEKSTSPLSKQDDQSFKNYENISKKLLIEQLSKAEQELKKYQESLLKYEERSFKYTNAFTSAGEGSVLEMSKRYRHLQHNKRAAAARALKRVHKIDVRDHLCDHIMSAYETARSVVLDEVRKCIQNNLFELQTNDERDKELLQGCMVILSCVQENERIKNMAINQINTTLDQLYKKLLGDKPLPSEVEDYYQSLAELAWCAVARPIPMIIAKSPDAYCKSYHELKDSEDVEDGSPVSYVYPVLYSSNDWPRQVAQQGRVVLKQHL